MSTAEPRIAQLSGGGSIHGATSEVEERRKAARLSAIVEPAPDGPPPLIGIAGSMKDFLGKLSMAEPDAVASTRKWKQSLMNIKPTYLFDVRGDGTPRKQVFAQTQIGDEVWLRFTDGSIAGLKEIDLGDGNRKVVCLRDAKIEALIELGAVSEEDRAEVQEKINAPKRALLEQLKKELGES